MEACVGHMDANSQNDWPTLTTPWFVDHILQPLRDPAWPFPILKDFSDVTLVGSDDRQNKAHKIILAWPDWSKKGLLAWRGLSARPGLSACWPVGLLACWPGQARPVGLAGVARACKLSLRFVRYYGPGCTVRS